MNILKIALAGGVALLVMVAHAHANPAVLFPGITFSLWSGPLGAVLSWTAINIGLHVAAIGSALGCRLVTARRR